MADELSVIKFHDDDVHDCMPLGYLNLNDRSSVADGGADPVALFALPTDYNPNDVVIRAKAFGRDASDVIEGKTVRAELELSMSWSGSQKGPICVYVYIPKASGDITLWGRPHDDSAKGGWIRTPDVDASSHVASAYIAASVVSEKRVHDIDYLRILVCWNWGMQYKFGRSTIDIGINS